MKYEYYNCGAVLYKLLTLVAVGFSCVWESIAAISFEVNYRGVMQVLLILYFSAEQQQHVVVVWLSDLWPNILCLVFLLDDEIVKEEQKLRRDTLAKEEETKHQVRLHFLLNELVFSPPH